MLRIYRNIAYICNRKRETMQSEFSKMLDLLASNELSLQKAQEHIDRLLAIIDNLTKQG